MIRGFPAAGHFIVRGFLFTVAAVCTVLAAVGFAVGWLRELDNEQLAVGDVGAGLRP